MSINTRTATALDFERVAQNHANLFWGWAVVSAMVFYFAGFFGFIPGVITVYCIIQSVGASSAAMALKKGTYKVPNPNNGAPDGDARNWNQS